MQDSVEVNIVSKMMAGSLLQKLKYLFSYCSKYKISGKLNLNVFWHFAEFSRNVHYEDVESWIEKYFYLIKMMNLDAKIEINHYLITDKKNFTPFEIVGHKNITPKFLRKMPKKTFFKTNLKAQKNKVCFWRYNESVLTYLHPDPNQNGRVIREASYTPDEWNMLYNFLKKNYDVVELEYRTPIREVFYHLSTCEFSIGYSGMWCLLSTLLDNPTVGLVDPKLDKFRRQKIENFEYLCLPKIEQITDLDYFQSLVKKAKRATRLAKRK